MLEGPNVFEVDVMAIPVKPGWPFFFVVTRLAGSRRSGWVDVVALVQALAALVAAVGGIIVPIYMIRRGVLPPGGAQQSAPQPPPEPAKTDEGGS
ncbi:hypothetical protein Afe04nite_69880 [Asanoa ferruginea]|nr:hypothetical protein Afe04nite_69880 [Asanoa ferruginea]